MKRTFLTFIFLVLFQPTFIYPQWIQQNSGTAKLLGTVYFINENTGWAAGMDGTILKTTNGGTDWISQSITTYDNIRSIYFTNELNGWIALYEWSPFRHGSIYHSTDGGNSWYVQLSVTDFALLSLFFIDDMHGWVVGTNGIAYKTTNGGNYWQPMYINTNGGWLYSVRFSDLNTGWAAGDLLGQVNKTTDSGNYWFNDYIPTYNYLIDIFCLDQNLVWGVGQAGVIVRTTNGGTNWFTSQSVVTNELRDIHFIDQNNGWIAGFSGKILHSIDGGLSWNQQNSNTGTDLYAIYFVNELTGWVVGNNGLILKTDNGGVPVELTSFTYEIENVDVILNWATATETNNMGFRILKDDEEIAFIAGAGTTTEPREYSYKDENVKNGTYIYTLMQIDYDGTINKSGEVEVTIANIPKDFILEQNYPNPFNPTTTINYSIPKESHVSLVVYNFLGQEIIRLLDEIKEPGFYQLDFNGIHLPCGIYFYSITSEESSITKKMLLLK